MFVVHFWAMTDYFMGLTPYTTFNNVHYSYYCRFYFNT